MIRRLSTREAAKKLGISYDTLAHYVAVGKVPAPEIAAVGSRVIHMWTEAEIEHVRQLLPKIANGRKTRYKKKQLAISNSQLAKKKSKTRSKKKK
jgi:DNA-binding transcriptional MerR regulator